MKNIIDVEVPAILYERIRTGITWFDNTLTEEGGFVPSLVYMVSGMPGAGKSTLIRQVADALTGNDCVAVYNSGEESKFQIAIATQRMQIKHGFMVESIMDHKVLISLMNQVIADNPGKRVILIQDSLQKLTASAKPAAVTEALRDWAKKTGQIVVFICQVTKKGEFKGSNEIEHDIDVHIRLKVDKKSGLRTFIIHKNRFGPTTDDEGIAYVITSTGLELRYDDEEEEEVEEQASPSHGFQVGQPVEVTKKAHPKHRKKVGRVTKVGRTRVTVVTFKGEELYLPLDCFKVLPQISLATEQKKKVA